MEVILCRHSTTAGNQKKQYIGITDQPLCPEGEQLARRCTPDMEVETIYCSPLRRAVATGRILYPRARVVLVPALREMDFGLFEQKSYLDLGQDPQYQQWLDSGCQDPCPGGESIAQFARRVCQGFEQIVEQAAAQGQERVVLVAHGGTLMALMGTYAWPRQDYFQWKTPNCGGYAARWDGEKRRLCPWRALEEGGRL